MKKVVICLVYITIFFIVRKYHKIQSLFILLHWILFKWPKRNLLMNTYFLFFCFFVQKIIWWSDNRTLISCPHCAVFSLAFVNMWLIREDVLSVTLVGDCTICLNPKILQNSKYFFASCDILLVPFTMFLLFSLINKSPSTCHSLFKMFHVFKLSGNVSRNLNWSGGLSIIPAVIGFVFGIRSSIKIFSILFEMQFLVLKQILLLTTHYTSTLPISITSNYIVSFDANFTIVYWVI